MTLTEYAVTNRAISYFVVFLILVGGIASFFSLGQLEDPVFTIKKAVIVTPYPGASADEVELEVTDVIEQAIQELPELKHLYSFSRPGLSIIKVDIKERYWSDRLPQIWDAMRKKIRDITPQLPPGVGIAQVEAARGRLIHFVETEERHVRRYQIVAPTEWNFHPDGVLVRGLTGLPVDGPEAALRTAELFVHAVDPCVQCDIEVERAA